MLFSITSIFFFISFDINLCDSRTSVFFIQPNQGEQMEITEKDRLEASGTGSGSADPLLQPPIDTQDVHEHEEQHPDFNVPPSRPPSPLSASIFREHNYAGEEKEEEGKKKKKNERSQHEMGEEENRFNQANVSFPLILRERYRNLFIRTIGTMAFRYSCVDVNYTVSNTNYRNSHGDYQQNISQLYHLVFDEIRHQYRFIQRFKLNLGIHAVFDNPYGERSENLALRSQVDPELDRYIWLSSREFDEGTDLVDEVWDMLNSLIRRISSTESGPSGLIFKHFEGLTFSFNIFSYQFGGHFDRFLSLPDYIDLKSLVSPSLPEKEDDYSCFENCLRDYFTEQKPPKDITDFVKLDSIKPKMSLLDVGRFEKANPNIQIHVFVAELQELEDDQDKSEKKLDFFSLAYKSKNEYNKDLDMIQILLYLHKEHYYCIKDLGRFLHQKDGKRHYCFNCLMSFNRFSRLEKHWTYCTGKNTIIPCFSKKKLEFTNFSSILPPPFVCYYDLEV